MAWTTPKTWIAEEIIYAADLNVALRDNMLITEASVAEERGGLFTQSTQSERVTVSKFKSASFDIPNVLFTTSYAGDYIIGPPYVTVPRALSYMMWYSARQEKSVGGGKIFFGPICTTAGESLNDLRMYSSSTSAYRSSGVGKFDLFEISDLVQDEYTFGMLYGANTDDTGGVWAQRKLTILPIGPIPEL